VSPTVRAMAPVDARGVGVMHHQAWVDTYGDVVDGEYLTRRWTVDDAVAQWQGILSSLPESGVVRLVAHEGGTVVGFAAAGPSRSAAKGLAPAADLELWGLYVARHHHGTGLGQQLLDAAIPAGGPAELWVYRDNARARAFYARNGFRPDGCEFTDVRHPELGEIRMVR
jgi:GNAT superfamily N-acetyltransferase